MNIITGFRGEPHITSQEDRNTNIAIFGSGAHILNVGSLMSATVISANEIEISDGLVVVEGCTGEIVQGTTESLTIENGGQGEQRIDLIVARYTKDSGTGVEDLSLAVVKGTPATSLPAIPSYNTGAIADGDSPVDFPLYRVNIGGISITSVVRLVDVLNIASTAYTDAVRGGRIGAGYNTVTKALTTNYSIVPMGGNYASGSVFARTNDGGYRALKAGLVLVSASCAVADVNANDSVLVGIGRYNGGWIFESHGHFGAGVAAERSCDISTFPMIVSQNDVIYLRARNVSGARGNVTSARLLLEMV